MTAREHLKREREHVKTVRYYLKQRMYVQAFQSLAWALEQATAADLGGARQTSLPGVE